MKKTVVCLATGCLSLLALSEDIIWNGSNGYWATASEWTPAQVPNIHGGIDTATIGAGVVTNIASTTGVDWSNNSVVTISNGARWVQSGGIEWARAAGDGSGKNGILILKDSAEFKAGTASGFAIGIAGGDGVVQVNDNAILDCVRSPLMLSSYGAGSRGVLDLNGGNVTTYELRFAAGNFAQAQNTFGRLNISGGTATIISFIFYHTTVTGFDHAINFDGGNGLIKKSGMIAFQEGGVNYPKTWKDLYNSGKLLRNGTRPGEFDVYFNLIALGGASDELSVRTPITWEGGTGRWDTAQNWVGEALPNIKGGTNSVFINSGAVEYVPSGDWSNNSYVSLSNDAKWVQISGIEWVRIAGDGSRKRGTLVLNGTSEFKSGTASTVAIGISGGIGTVIVNDNSTLDTNGKAIIFGYNIYEQEGSSGTIDLNSGRVKTGSLCFTQIHVNTNDNYGVKTHGRIYISGGTFECTDGNRSILFANITASDYDHAIDFDGDSGEFITHGPLKIEYGANITEERSWEELFTSGFLLRKGSNAGSFDDHFVVKNLGGSKRSLQLRSHLGTVIVVR